MLRFGGWLCNVLMQMHGQHGSCVQGAVRRQPEHRPHSCHRSVLVAGAPAHDRPSPAPSRSIHLPSRPLPTPPTPHPPCPTPHTLPLQATTTWWRRTLLSWGWARTGRVSRGGAGRGGQGALRCRRPPHGWHRVHCCTARRPTGTVHSTQRSPPVTCRASFSVHERHQARRRGEGCGGRIHGGTRLAGGGNHPVSRGRRQRAVMAGSTVQACHAAPTGRDA